MVALVQHLNIAEMLMEEEFTIVKNPGKDDMEIITKKGEEISKYKQNQNEGGIATAMIAHWPAGIKNPGRMDRERGHLVDFHATFRELAGAEYPEEFNGEKLGAPRGLSLANAFKDEERPVHDELFYVFSNKYSALLQGDWKVVDQKYLYNLKEDRIESNDLSEKYPERFETMKARWTELNASMKGAGKGKGKGRGKNKDKK